MALHKTGLVAALALTVASLGAGAAFAQPTQADITAAQSVEGIIQAALAALPANATPAQIKAAVDTAVMSAETMGYTATEIYAALVALTPATPAGGTPSALAVALNNEVNVVAASLTATGAGAGSVSGAAALAAALGAGAGGGGGGSSYSTT